MKRRTCTAVAVFLLVSFMLTLVCYANETPLQKSDYYTQLQDATEETHDTVDSLTLCPSDSRCTLSGKDASADGTVTMKVGNTYNFGLDLTDVTDVSCIDVTGIYFYQEKHGDRGSLFLPLNEDGVYAYLYGFRPDDSNDYVSNIMLTEHVDFIDVALNEAVSSDTDGAPVFGLTGKIVITYSFEASGALTDQTFQNRYFDEDVLKTGDVVTYTLTIDGESSAISVSDYLLTDDNGTDYYSVGIGYKPAGSSEAFPTSVYTLTLDENGNSSTYNFLEDRSNDRCMEADIWLRVMADYTTKRVEAAEKETSAETPAADIPDAEESTVKDGAAAETVESSAENTVKESSTAENTDQHSSGNTRFVIAIILLVSAGAGATGIVLYVIRRNPGKSKNTR